MSPLRHLVSCASLGFGLLNLTFWCTGLLVFMLTRTLFPSTRSRIQNHMDAIYRAAVRCNDWWFRQVLGYRWQPPPVDLDPTRTYLVIANHQSWADSFLIQTAVVHHGPVLKVLVKEELARWPLLGLIFRAFDFPRLQRRASAPDQEPERRRLDTERIREACAGLARSPAAMLIYPEGTRFTAEKHQASADGGDCHRHLLPPRPGGFATVADTVRPFADAVLDIDIFYPETTRFWQFLSGALQEPVVRIAKVPLTRIADPAAWLRQRWQEKDQWLTDQAATRDTSL